MVLRVCDLNADDTIADSRDIGSQITACDPPSPLNKPLPPINYGLITMTPLYIPTPFHHPSTPLPHLPIHSTTVLVRAIRASAPARDRQSVFLIADSAALARRHPLGRLRSTPTDDPRCRTLARFVTPPFLLSEAVDNLRGQKLQSVSESTRKDHGRMRQSRPSQPPPRRLFGMS